jgi:hypothetical protein
MKTSGIPASRSTVNFDKLLLCLQENQDAMYVSVHRFIFIYQVLHCTMRHELAMPPQIPETQLSFFGYTYLHELGTGELGSLLARAC